MFCGEKIKEEKVKIKTQNEKIAKTDMDIWYYTYKKAVNSVRKNQYNVSSHKNNLQFAFKGPKYARNIVFSVDFFPDFWKILKK